MAESVARGLGFRVQGLGFFWEFRDLGKMSSDSLGFLGSGLRLLGFWCLGFRA